MGQKAERPGYVAGVDEAGRGALAGPVVAAAVILPEGIEVPSLRDSKLLSPLQRATICSIILTKAAAVGIGLASAREVDEENVLNASLAAMARAVSRLEVVPEFVLVDGNREIPITIAQAAVVGGDRKVPVISAASIVAKVYRDALMERLAVKYPGYGFERHKGYGTRSHVEAILRIGPTSVHRVTFRPMAELKNNPVGVSI